MTRIADLFYSELRAELLRILFGLRKGRLNRAQIIRLTFSSKTGRPFAKGSVEEELGKLVDLDLLTTSKEHTLRFYAANQANPLFPELRNIVLKTVGLRDVLGAALQSDKIVFAFVFGSLAQLTERAESDVDLMVIGQITNRELTGLLRGVADQVGREVNPHIFSRDELARRLENGDHFLSDVIDKPKLFVKGNENEFEDLVRGRMAPSS